MMASRAPPPLWLRDRSRFADIGRGRAIMALALLFLALLASLAALTSGAAPSFRNVQTGGTDGQTDLMLYDSIIDGVRHGGAYYAVAADALRAGDYPLRPFVAFRLPTLAIVEAWLPRVLVVTLLYLLGLAVALTWFARLRAIMAGPAALAAALLALDAGMIAFLQPSLVSFHEIWAGMLVALSLGLRRPDRWVESVALALAALLVRETAALYVAVMALFAILEGRRAETLGWTGITAVYAVVIALHAHAVAQVVRPLDPVSPGWSGLLGIGFFIRTVAASTALSPVPDALAAVTVVLALFGWCAWRDPLAPRALATFLLYAMLLSVASRADTFYWGLMIAPTLLIGLAFVPDGLRDLLVAAHDRRRITVTRIGRAGPVR